MLTSISITPATLTLAAGTSAPLSAVAVYSDGSTLDVTATATWTSSDDTRATVSTAGVVDAVAPGDVTITAAVDAVSATAQLTVTNATLQSIALTPDMPMVPLGTRVQLQAVGTFSDGSTQDISAQAAWASSDMLVASVDATGLVETLATGSTTVSASLQGITGNATVTVTDAALVSMAITPAPLMLASGTGTQLTATALFSDGSTLDVTAQSSWSSSDASVLAVSDTVATRGRATAMMPGTATITATFNGVQASIPATVTNAVLVSIEIQPPTPTVARGTQRQLTAVGTFTDGSSQDLTEQAAWTSSDGTIAAVSNTVGTRGLLSALQPGMATITATLGGVMGSTAVTVSPAQLVSLDVTPAGATLAKGTTQQFTATGTFSDNTTQDLTTRVTWTSSDAAVATISNAAGNNGRLTAVEQGSATITAAMGGVMGTTDVTVTAASLVSLAISPVSPMLARGTALQLTATGTYSDGTTQDLSAQVTWSSSDGAVATVSNALGSQGRVSALAEGTATITAALGGVMTTVDVTVTAAQLVSIAVTPTSASIANGTRQAFVATGTYSDNSTQDLTAQVTWSSSDPAVATVSNAAGSQGVATAVGQGSTVIAARLSGISGMTNLTVTAAVLTSISVTPAMGTVVRASSVQFTATGTFSDGTTQDLTTQATWSSSNLAVATISNADGSRGLARTFNAGTTTVSAALSGVTGSTTLQVNAATLQSIAVTPAMAAVPVNTTQAYRATGTYDDGTVQDITGLVVWSSSDAAVATISNAARDRGLATTLSAGSTTISAVLGGVTGTATLTVNAATLSSLTITPVDPSIQQGSRIALVATGAYSDGSMQDVTARVTWSTSDAAVATISNAAGTQGLATGVSAGMVTVTAVQGAVSATTTLTIITAALTDIEVTPADSTMAINTERSFTATGVYSDGSRGDVSSQVMWSSDNNAVITVANNGNARGIATALAVGTANITATLGAVSGQTGVTVTNATLQSITVTPATSQLPAGLRLPYTATGTFSDGSTQDLSGQVAWTSSDNAVATIAGGGPNRGNATTVAPGMATISATLFNVSGTAELTVTSAVLQSITVTPANPILTIGQVRQMTATGNFSDGSTVDLGRQVAWVSDNNNVATVGNSPTTSGKVTAIRRGSATITATFTTADGTNVSGATVVTVN